MTTTDRTATDVRETQPGRPDGPSRSRTLIALAVLCVLLAVAAVVLGLQLRGHAQEQEARDDALRAARQSAINLTSIDAEQFDEAVEAVLDGATGDFRREFEANSEDLQQLLRDNEVSASGKVLDAGLVRSDKSNATALVVVDSTVENTASPEGRVNTYRMQIEVEKVDGEWLTSSLRFVG
jgi:Mce-associated membrane protein